MGHVTEQTREQRVLVRHCTPVVFPLSISQSSSAVYSEVNHVQRPGRDVCFPPALVPKMNCLIHLKLEIESRLEYAFQELFYVLKIHIPKFGSVWKRLQVMEEKKIS